MLYLHEQPYANLQFADFVLRSALSTIYRFVDDPNRVHLRVHVVIAEYLGVRYFSDITFDLYVFIRNHQSINAVKWKQATQNMYICKNIIYKKDDAYCILLTTNRNNHMITFFVLFTHIQNFHLSFEPTPSATDSDTKLDSKVEKKDEADKTDFKSIDNEKVRVI